MDKNRCICFVDNILDLYFFSVGLESSSKAGNASVFVLLRVYRMDIFICCRICITTTKNHYMEHFSHISHMYQEDLCLTDSPLQILTILDKLKEEREQREGNGEEEDGEASDIAEEEDGDWEGDEPDEEDIIYVK